MDGHRLSAQNRRVIETPDAPRFPHICIKLSGSNANRLHLVGQARRAMERNGIPDDVVETYVLQALSGSYHKALQTTLNWITVI